MDHDMENKSQQPEIYPLHFLQKITENFSPNRELGSGGFGTVYKGVDNTGNILAVKRIRFCEGMKDKIFEDEVINLINVKHQNIVNFKGYCHQEETKLTLFNGKQFFLTNKYMLLCFEYLPNGDLRYYIKDKNLDWTTRYKIIGGICKGLHYLHEELKKAIIHLDLKPANILLDESMMPKITDFGQARLLGNENTHLIAKNISGTRGYMAPEYIEENFCSKMSDIYSLGVMIIEIILGEKKYPKNLEMPLQEFIEKVHQEWRRRLLASRNTLLEEYCQQVKMCTEIGLKCMEWDPKDRPSIVDIIYTLNERSKDGNNLDTVTADREPTVERHEENDSKNKEVSVILREEDEDEDVLLEIKAKLSYFYKEESQWKERVTGTMKVLKHKDHDNVGLLMRQAETHKICAGFIVSPKERMMKHPSGDAVIMWLENFMSDDFKFVMFAIRFESVENCKKFMDLLEEIAETTFIGEPICS